MSEEAFNYFNIDAFFAFGFAQKINQSRLSNDDVDERRWRKLRRYQQEIVPYAV